MERPSLWGADMAVLLFFSRAGGIRRLSAEPATRFLFGLPIRRQRETSGPVLQRLGLFPFGRRQLFPTRS